MAPPKVFRHPRTGMQVRIGVMGSAEARESRRVTQACRELGSHIAQAGCCLLTGACPGLPHETVLGAKSARGHVVGISPASSLAEHVDQFESPYREYDVLIFTGLGLMGRELVNIRSSDIVIVVGGRSGTLGEFAIAYEEGKLIGVLKNSGGIAEGLADIQRRIGKATGSEVLYEDDPATLVSRLLARYVSEEYSCPCHPAALRKNPRAKRR